MSKLLTSDVIVLGAGGAGLMCAAVAGQHGRRVTLLDHNDAPGKKILISGGGRCNFTNIAARPECFLSDNPHFAKSALSRFTSQDFIALVDQYRIFWHEKTLGQLFCDGSAKQIVSMLLDECRLGNVQFNFGESVLSVRKDGKMFHVETNQTRHEAQSLVVATGGPSIPKLGATGFAYDLARQFGLKVVEPRPALVPLTLGGDDILFRELSGVSADVEVSHASTTFREAALFTHKGLSGPSILQISSYWRHGDSISVKFCPDAESDWLTSAKKERPRSSVPRELGRHLPSRLAGALAAKLGIDGVLGGVSDVVLEKAGRRLANWSFNPNGTEGFGKAEVTIGGVSTAELSSKTMETRKIPNLFFIGEAVDVTGWLGGYNFQWAWSSGVAAGEVA